MLPYARVQAAIEILEEVISTPRPADTLASAYFRNRRYIGSKDRAAVNMRIYRIMRTWHRFSWWIKKCGGEVNARTLAIADLMFEREYSIAEVERMFSGERFAPATLQKEELKLVNALNRQDLDHPHIPLRERMECPEWAFEPLQKCLGDRFESEMKAMMTPAPMDLRVNSLKATRDEALEQLKKDGIDASAGKISPLSIRVFGRPQVLQHPLFMSGAIEIQDEGSQMVAVAADAKPGEQVADYCAGAGGKTLALGASMNNKGRIVAMDVLESRLTRAKLRFRRAGLHNIETHLILEEGDKWIKRHRDHFNLVLVDAPCTGTGTWRRDPDKRFRMLGPGITELVPLQRKILESAHRLVKKGGRLVYATCSLLPEENENQIESFIKDHPEFEVKGDFLKLTPAQNDTDGFFAAVMVRKP